ncbi:MAG: multidrug efflux SMR transporter [Nevskiaceae bacterium]|nr:MAG: multidrug efflux SMR transporter [Nevskiaceae bacterium]TBR73468.1 MAG: multidrug efflux SMR transporter [Nevskiaceae bacterium]
MTRKHSAWAILLAAVVFEVVFILALNASRAFTVPGPAAVTIVATIFGMVLLSRALRELDVGIGYTVWVGLGAVGAVGFGALLFGEALTWPRLGCFALILGGVAGLKLADGRSPTPPRDPDA